jgi:toluene monooxygenase system ferredoxin subunit
MTGAQSELLQGLSAGDADVLLALGARLELESGAELFALGAPAESLYLVESGRVALTLPMRIRDSEEEVLVEERLSGQTVGWSALVAPHRFTLRATARTTTTLVAFPRAALLDHLAARPAVGYLVARNLAAVIGQRLQLFQTMWLREVQRVVELRCS